MTALALIMSIGFFLGSVAPLGTDRADLGESIGVFFFRVALFVLACLAACVACGTFQ